MLSLRFIMQGDGLFAFLSIFFFMTFISFEVVYRRCFSCLVCMVSSGGMAAKEPGECSQRRPMWSHSHFEEKASEHPEFYSGSAQERPLETTRPAGKSA